MNQRWYYRVNKQVKGPLDIDILQSLAASGAIRPDHDVRSTRSQEWRRAGDVAELFPQVAADGDLDAMLSAAPSVDEMRSTLADSPKQKHSTPVGRQARPPAPGCYCRIRGRVEGPMPFEEVGRLARLGGLTPNDDVRLGEDTEWVAAGTIVGLFQSQLESRPSAPVAAFGQPATQLSVHAVESDVIPLGTGQLAKTRLPEKSNPTPVQEPQPRSLSLAYGEVTDEKTWYARLHGHEIGPFTFGEVFDLAASGRLTRSDQVRDGARGRWLEANSIAGLFPDTEAGSVDEAFELRPVAPPRQQTQSSRTKGARDHDPRRPLKTRPGKSSEPVADDLAKEVLGSDTDEPLSSVSSPARAHLAPAQAERPRAIASVAAPAPRLGLPPPPQRQRRTEPVLSGLQVGGKHLATVGILLTVATLWYFGIPAFNFGGTGPTVEVQTICQQLVVLRDRDNLQLADWNAFKAETLPKVEELASRLEADGADDPKSERMLRCCREYLPAILDAGPNRLTPEWGKMVEAISEATT